MLGTWRGKFGKVLCSRLAESMAGRWREDRHAGVENWARFGLRASTPSAWVPTIVLGSVLHNYHDECKRLGLADRWLRLACK